MTESDKAAALREQALARIKRSMTAPAPEATESDLKRLVHELHVHQAELEIQNEELVYARGELEASRERYAELYDFAPVGYFTLDRDGFIRGANLRAASLLRVPRNVLAGQEFRRFVAPRSAPTFGELLASVLTGRDPIPVELDLTAGGERPLAVIVAATRAESGHEVRMVMSDISAQKRAEADLHRAEGQLRVAQKLEAVALLAGGIAHDLNNILTPIIANADLGLMDLDDKGAIREDLAEIRTAAGRAADLVHQLLVIGRRDQRAAPSPVNLVALAKETGRLLRASLPATIDIRVDATPACWPVLADVSQMHQVLLNLCTNAGFSMQETGGTLTIGVEPETRPGHATSVKVTVSDTGGGIAPEHLPRIFEPYFTTKPAGKGSGLGLAVVHGIVTHLGGEVRVRSQLGVGTTFEVLLPAIVGTSDASGAPLEEVPRGRGEHVLVVDDEVAIERALVRLLGALGYRVTAVPTAVAALVAVRSDPNAFDVVLTDHTMPGMGGLALADELLRIRPDLPILLGTGFSEGVDDAAVVQRGLRGMLNKPYSTRALGEALHRALARG